MPRFRAIAVALAFAAAPLAFVTPAHAATSPALSPPTSGPDTIVTRNVDGSLTTQHVTFNSTPVGPQANYAGITCKNAGAMGWGHSCGFEMSVDPGPWGVHYTAFYHDPKIAFIVPSDVHTRTSWSYNGSSLRDWSYYVFDGSAASCRAEGGSPEVSPDSHACVYSWNWNNPYDYYAPGTYTIEGYGAKAFATWDQKYYIGGEVEF